MKRLRIRELGQSLGNDPLIVVMFMSIPTVTMASFPFELLDQEKNGSS